MDKKEIWSKYKCLSGLLESIISSFDPSDVSTVDPDAKCRYAIEKRQDLVLLKLAVDKQIPTDACMTYSGDVLCPSCYKKISVDNYPHCICKNCGQIVSFVNYPKEE